ncbi:4'-phosphopantetheinyl transferase superfamily protein [Blastococcus sp. MG754426]|uniref:4'-phosphopantetheinyl transferase family protein n=1 Tax=unclassified Blastococcus TaxID=2619396 RepID=UPI001EF0D3D9|nr:MULTISPECIES: 4'-phosphopantetheinyl transferase superfamily protein [unclassified Blastococcus]MCF6508269.1 4'-phosphopantetheinyl transferase superfamily protein [Blastococcus sp. MG754426]MCF6512940.1 4'-phosphopantetheinyl transferase superfamily protein [Blastococcus sp. MG754427]MCF6734279.1 4'-phosphopantetheinyl transferase superfamily protein [Blastococcus sp. KM273129]
MSASAAPAARPAVGALPHLAPGSCQVWWIDTDEVHAGHDDLLDPDDVVRRGRLHRPADRRRTTAAWAVARLVLGGLAGLPPEALRIDRTCLACGGGHGKPRLLGDVGLHVSVSHAGNRAVVAVGRDAPVGVDIEQVGAWADADLTDVARLVLAPEERAVLARQPAGTRAEVFTTYWTRKEAAVKATGAGLSAPLDDIVVSSPAFPPHLLRWGAGNGDVPAPSLAALAAPAGFVGTVAVLGPAAPRVVEHDAGPLLRRCG